MKVRFTEAPKGRDFTVGQVAEFKGYVEESYARKYVARGWAVEIDEAAERRAAAEAVAQERAAAKAAAEAAKGQQGAKP